MDIQVSSNFERLLHDIYDNPKIVIKQMEKLNLAICPHTAVGTFVSRKFLNKNKVMITLATAHPSKFIDSVQSAIGKMIAQPIEMKQLYSKTERVIHAPNEVNFYKNYINREI